MLPFRLSAYPYSCSNPWKGALRSVCLAANTPSPTPSRSADLISKAIAGGPKEAQLVARSRPEEPDEWMWLSEAEKDDLRYDMSRIDRW